MISGGVRLPEESSEDLRSEHEQTRELLEHRLAFEQLISTISTNFRSGDMPQKLMPPSRSAGRNSWFTS